MNRSSGVLQTSPVQQMIAGNPNWWSINGGAAIRPPPSSSHHHQQLMISSPFCPPPPASPFFSQFSPSNSSSSSSNWHDHNNNTQDHHLPADSWSQLLMGGLVGEEDKCGGMESFHHQQTPSGSVVEVKQESSGGNGGSCYVQYGNHDQVQSPAASWSHHHHHHMMPLVSSPNNKSSCITAATTFSSTNNMLDFSGTTNNGGADVRHPPPTLDRSSNSECNSPASGGALKKARVQPSASQSTFKVRKEKLGDRITALHQLVSPFGKTDTASVLLEAIGYIRFLQSQIEALSMPYLSSTGSAAAGTLRHQQSAVQGEMMNSMFPEDPGQLLNTSSMKRKGGPDQEYCGEQEGKKDLRSRGLCLVPVSCTLQVGSDNGADYWAPASLGPNAGFR